MRSLLALTLLLLSAVLTSAALAQDADGQISGVVVDLTGQPQAGQRVELRRLARRSARLGKLTDPNGQFVFAGLSAGRYEVEVRAEGRVVATSGPIELSGQMMQVSNVTVAPPAPPAPPPTPPPPQSRTSVGHLLGGRPAPTTFEALASILAPGYEVVVRDEAGRRTRGRVSSISDDRIVIFEGRSHGVRSARERIFAADAVARIDIVDSMAKGIGIGAAAGAGFWYVLRRKLHWRPQGNPELPGQHLLPPGLYVILAIPALFCSIYSGANFDLFINKPIYERPSRTPRITLAPLLGRERIGAVAQVRF